MSRRWLIGKLVVAAYIWGCYVWMNYDLGHGWPRTLFEATAVTGFLWAFFHPLGRKDPPSS